MPRQKFHKRPCKDCGVELIDVRDAKTYATFPVEARFRIEDGYVLEGANDPRMNPWARGAKVYVPHLPLCKGAPVDGPSEEETVADETAPEDPGEPAGVGSDPIQDDPPAELPIGDEDPGKGPN